MKTIKERQALAERLPWVSRLKESTACEGVKWSTVAVRDIFSWGPGLKNPPRGIQPRSRCKNRAWWHYVPLGNSPYARRYHHEGNYCWVHTAQLLDHEWSRTRRYIERYLKESDV